jgi:hypothetical protein
MKANAIETQDSAIASYHFDHQVVTECGEIVILSSEHLAYSKRARRSRWLSFNAQEHGSNKHQQGTTNQDAHFDVRNVHL